MRISSATALLLVLAACSAEKDTTAPAGSASGAAVAEGPEKIECALHGAPGFARDCVVERTQQDGVAYLVVRHPDGAFRRFQVLKDGRGVAVADGADEAVTSIINGGLEATVGKDRYRFPAAEKRHEPTS